MRLEPFHALPCLLERLVRVPGLPVCTAVPGSDNQPLVHALERNQQLAGDPPVLAAGGGEAVPHCGVPLRLRAHSQNRACDDRHHRLASSIARLEFATTVLLLQNRSKQFGGTEGKPKSSKPSRCGSRASLLEEFGGARGRRHISRSQSPLRQEEAAKR